MDMGFEQKIRERAYEIWMAAGMADGMELEHWCAAELDLTAKPAKKVAAKPETTKTKIAAKTAKAAPKAAALKAKAPTAKGSATKMKKPAASKEVALSLN